jgi:hypothetical protein
MSIAEKKPFLLQIKQEEIIFVYLISPPFDINKKINQKLPLRRCFPFIKNWSESLLKGNKETKTVG